MLLSYVRTVVLYLVLILAIRMMGKRQIGQMEASEFVVTMLVANLASIPMQDGAIPLYSGLVPILTVLGLELVLSGLILRSVFVRRLLCGRPVILIENGKISQQNLRRTRVTLDELMGHLREKDVLDITAVRYAILETDGNLSVFLWSREEGSLPFTIIEDGKYFAENLKKSGNNENWLNKTLKKYHSDRENTFLLTVDGDGKTVHIPREEP